MSKKTILARVANMIKDTIDNRINYPRREVRAMLFITVSDLQKVEKLVRSIKGSKGKEKKSIVEQDGAGYQRKHLQEDLEPINHSENPTEVKTTKGNQKEP